MNTTNSTSHSIEDASKHIGWAAVLWAMLGLASPILLGISFWLIGRWTGNKTRLRDFKYVMIALALLQRRLILDPLQNLVPALPYIIATVVTFVFLLYALRKTSAAHRVDDDKHVPQASFLRPMLLPCRTTHARLFPEQHSFSYSYLLVGFPVGQRHTTGSILSTDVPDDRQSSKLVWFTVVAEDYLARGPHSGGLRGKLDDYLHDQGQDPDQFPFAYLVTAPRFLGFAFNPISFWYLYGHDQDLKAMILEVNNTFDERRMYFMFQGKRAGDPTASTTFTNSWQKDFHVSPFNDRDGSYSLTAANPFPRSSTAADLKIDNDIVLLSPEGKPKILARVFSTSPGRGAASFSYWSTMSFVAKWWWVGFMTNPRILREAWSLWMKKLQVFYRPEVYRTTIGRNETREETVLEQSFFRFFRDVANVSDRIWRYTPAAGSDRGQQVFHKSRNHPTFHSRPVSPCTPSVEAPNPFELFQNDIEFKVLTPAFYAELIRTNDYFDFWDRICFKAPPDEAMLYVSDTTVVKKCLDTIARRKNDEVKFHSRVHTINDELRKGSNIFSAILRGCRAYRQISWDKTNFNASTDSGQTADTASTADLQEIIRASLIFSHPIRLYDKMSFIILLADKLALGSVLLLKSYVRLVRMVSVYKVAQTIRGLVYHGMVTDRRISGIAHNLPSALVFKFLVSVSLLQLASRTLKGMKL